MEIEITTENYDNVMGQGLPVVLDFYATWCGPCKKIAPYLEELAAQYDGQVVVARCDVDDNNDLAVRFGVRNIPTVIYFKNGEICDKIVGAAQKSAFEDKLKALL